MAIKNSKKLSQDDQHVADVRKQNINVMMPFVKFSIGALGLVAKALFSVVTLLPKLKPEKKIDNGGTKIIHIK